METKNFHTLIEHVKSMPVRNMAVTAADDQYTVEAACYASEQGIIRPIFIGNKAGVEEHLQQLGYRPGAFEIIHEKDPLKAPFIACELVAQKQASIIMKGYIDTSDFLRGILNKENGVRDSRAMSHVAVLQLPGYHKLIGITDGGMITHPDYNAKMDIIRNAVQTFRGIGYECPKVAALTAVEKVNKAMPETLDAFHLQEDCRNGLIKDCIIEGPVSYDIAMSAQSARYKGFHGKHAGDYDIFLVPDIATGNIVSKALIYNAGAKLSGIVAGAKVPLVLNSRSSPAEEKYYAIVLAAASCMSSG